MQASHRNSSSIEPLLCFFILSLLLCLYEATRALSKSRYELGEFWWGFLTVYLVLLGHTDFYFLPREWSTNSYNTPIILGLKNIFTTSTPSADKIPKIENIININYLENGEIVISGYKKNRPQMKIRKWLFQPTYYVPVLSTRCISELSATQKHTKYRWSTERITKSRPNKNQFYKYHSISTWIDKYF